MASPPSRAQIEKPTDNLSKGNQFTQLGSSSKGKELIQSSDVINDVLKKVEGTNLSEDKVKTSVKSEEKETKSLNTEEPKQQLSEEEKRDKLMQSADKYDKYDSGNSKIDHLGEIGDMLDEGDDERKENQRAQQEAAMEAQKRREIERRALQVQPAQSQRLNRMSRVRPHHGQMRRHNSAHQRHQIHEAP